MSDVEPGERDVEPGDEALWRSVAATLRDVVAPALPPGYERDTVVQLQGLARFAAHRPAKGRAERARQLADALGSGDDLPLGAALRQASQALVDAVRDGPAARSGRVREVLLDQLAQDTAVAAPLLETFSGHPATDVPPVDRAVPPGELAALTGWFADALAAPVQVARAVVLSGGHSRRMLRVDLDAAGERRSYVVRVEQGGTFGTDGTVEARAMQALHAQGVPVAPVRWVQTSPAPLGQPFFVMDLVDGGSAVDDTVLTALLVELDRVHRGDPALLAPALGPPPSPEAALAGQVERWTEIYRQSVPDPVPLLDEAAAWLRRHLHPTGPLAVVHGDPGPGNLLSRDGRVTALTDWEFVHYGDAAEDWAYLATIRGRKVMSAAQWYSRIAEVVGVRHPSAAWHAWEVFNQFKGACANLTALRLFRDGVATTPNLLAIGTAVHWRFLRQLADLVGRPPV